MRRHQLTAALVTILIFESKTARENITLDLASAIGLTICDNVPDTLIDKNPA